MQKGNAFAASLTRVDAEIRQTTVIGVTR